MNFDESEFNTLDDQSLLDEAGKLCDLTGEFSEQPSEYANPTIVQKGEPSKLLGSGALELAAEDLRISRAYIGDVVGVKTSDSLLGDIFSSFCIGK